MLVIPEGKTFVTSALFTMHQWDTQKPPPGEKGVYKLSRLRFSGLELKTIPRINLFVSSFYLLGIYFIIKKKNKTIVE